jgi:hypothetical protein
MSANIPPPPTQNSPPQRPQAKQQQPSAPQTPDVGRMRLLGGCLGVLATLALCIGTPLLLVGLGISNTGSFLGQTLDSVGRGLSGIINPQASAAITMTIEEEEIRLMGKLTSFEATFRSEGVCVDVQWGAFNANGFGACYEMLFRLQAGVDLTREDLQVEQTAPTRYRVTLPPIELTSCSLRVVDGYNYTATLVSNAYWDDTRKMAEYQALLRFVQEGSRDEYIQQAERNAANEIENFLEQFVDGLQADVVFAPGAVRIDRSCEQTLPERWDFTRGWQFDPQTQTWTSQ